MPLDRDNVLDALKQGLSTELWGQRFYAQALERTQAVDGKRIFQFLLTEEMKHLEILRGQYNAYMGQGQWISVEDARALGATMDPADIFPAPESQETSLARSISDEEALRVAIAFEQRGIEYYRAQAESASSSGARATWEYLAKAEGSHARLLQNLYDHLIAKGAWHIDERTTR